MIRRTAMAVLLTAASCAVGRGQVTPPTILEIDVENSVIYVEDTSDPSKLATDPNMTTAIQPRNFGFNVYIADIVAVNGQPAKGTFTRNRRSVILNPVPNSGQGMADTVRNDVTTDSFEILRSDSNQIGTIVGSGLGGGSRAPGAPLSITQANLAITGGTGAFLGVRGQLGQSLTTQNVTPRVASMTEDPVNRRLRAGGRQRFVLQVIPISTPQIVPTSGGPAVTHSSDFSLVTASKPAAAGEILSLFVTGLGPTVPGVDPGKPFPASPPAVVNSPVDVRVNGKSAEIIGAVGFPGAVDGYQVNFRVPSDVAKGAATIQVSAAWIIGPGVTIAIQ